MLTICGLTLDLIFVTSLARSWPRPHMTTHYEAVGFLVCVCLTVNLAAYVYLGRRYFPNYRFERSLVISAGCLGNVVCSLFLSRVLDPALLSPVPSAYASSLLLFMFPSTTAKNKIMMNLVERGGGFVAAICGALFTWVWVVVFMSYAGGGGGGGGVAAILSTDSANSQGRSKAASAETVGGQASRRMSKSRRDASMTHQAQTSDSRGNSDGEDHGEGKGGGDDGSGGDEDDERTLLLEQGAGGPAKTSTPSSRAAGTRPLVHLSEPSEVLSAAQLSFIEGWLPADKQSRRWALRYSLLRDGASLDTLLYTCSSHATGRRSSSGALLAPLGYVLLIEDSRSFKFGAFLSHAVEARASYDVVGSGSAGLGAAGSGESFVFSFGADLPRGQCFTWTGKNDCFFLASARSGLCIGGGSSGSYALHLDDELDFGSSGSCETYDNPCLASGEYYKCLNAEVYELTDFV